MGLNRLGDKYDYEEIQEKLALGEEVSINAKKWYNEQPPRHANDRQGGTAAAGILAFGGLIGGSAIAVAAPSLATVAMTAGAVTGFVGGAAAIAGGEAKRYQEEVAKYNSHSKPDSNYIPPEERKPPSVFSHRKSDLDDY